MRRVNPGATVLGPLLWLVALAIPALAVGFLIGLVRWRLYVAEALQRLAARLSHHSGAGDLRAALADSFDDPRLSLVYATSGPAVRWLGLDRQPASLPRADSGRSVTEVANGGRPVAAIIHDVGLEDHRPFTDAVAGYALIALENERLASELQISLREVSESRARILAAADDERRRIERDLHDGAQQRLVALRIRLELAEELVSEAPEQGRQRLHELGEELEDALEEIQSLARGVYPTLLASQGLAAALRAAALRAPVAVTVTPLETARYPREIETAVYFCCLEALQNAIKHAAGATEVSISLVERGGALNFGVRDNGIGFDAQRPQAGAGLTNMADRLAAVGGSLVVRSRPGRGTAVEGHAPLTARR